MQTDFNYKEEASSGFDRDLARQGSNDNGRTEAHWLRQSKNSQNIDDLPIPTALEGGPKTFEELLAEKIEAE